MTHEQLLYRSMGVNDAVTNPEVRRRVAVELLLRRSLDLDERRLLELTSQAADDLFAVGNAALTAVLDEADSYEMAAFLCGIHEVDRIARRSADLASSTVSLAYVEQLRTLVEEALELLLAFVQAHPFGVAVA